MKGLRILLLVIAVVCIGVAVSYPIRYQRELQSNNEELADLSAMRRRVLEEESQAGTPDGEEGAGENIPDEAPEAGYPLEEGPDVLGAEALPEGADGTVEPGGSQHASGDTSAITEPTREAGEDTSAITGPTGEAGEDTSAITGPTREAGDDTFATEKPYLAAGDDASAPVEPEQYAEGPQGQAVEPGNVDEGTPSEVVPGNIGEGTSPEVVPGSIGEGTSPGAVPGSIGEGTSPEVVPGDIGEGTSPEVVPGSVGEGTSPGAVPGDIRETVSPEDQPVGTLAPEGSEAAGPSFTPPPTPIPNVLAFIINDPDMVTPTPSPSPTPTPTPSPSPSPTPDRTIRTGALAYKYLEKVELDPSKILPELREIYEINQDLVGWISIEDTLIDYPVVQCQDSEYYLKHDFYGKSNANGQIILDTKCDPYTPSYNLIISGHHMNSGAMFGKLPLYRDKKYWEKHKVVEFDTLMERKKYVIFAVFYSADYDEDETGFRYNADIQYKIEAEKWLEEIKENQIYDTGFHARFGDEFITLTTCDRSRRRNGRFVAVARRIREGERII